MYNMYTFRNTGLLLNAFYFLLFFLLLRAFTFPRLNRRARVKLSSMQLASRLRAVITIKVAVFFCAYHS